jgi:UDP-glucuronate decarboxylase
MLEGFVHMMAIKRVLTGPVNLSNPGEFTMLEPVQKVLRLVGSKSKLIFKPLPVDDPMQTQPDITPAMANLDRSPKVNFEDPLKETEHYFRTLLSA